MFRSAEALGLEEHAALVRPSGDVALAIRVGRVNAEAGDEDHVVEHIRAKDVVNDTVTGHKTDLRSKCVGLGRLSCRSWSQFY